MEVRFHTSMKTVNVNDKSSLEIASKVILEGGLIVYPTDTLYGIGADARNKKAIKKINRIKRRETPISVIVWSVDVAGSWVLTTNEEFKIASAYIKKSSTVILPVKDKIVDSLILGNDHTLGMRMPDCDFPINLCKKLGFPITTTSVNRTNNPPLGDPKYIREQFSSEIDLIVDAGIIKNRKASTIYKLIDSKFTVIRSG